MMSVSAWLRKETRDGSRRLSSLVRFKGNNALRESGKSTAKITKSRAHRIR